MAAAHGKSAKVKVTSAAATTSTGEAMTSLSPTTDRFEFRITDGTMRHWDRDQTLAVYVNTTLHTDYVANPVQGKVTFTAAALTTAEGDAVTADVRYHTATYLPITRSWTLDVAADFHDVTAFSTTTGDAKWRVFTDGLFGATVDLGRFGEGPPATTGYQPEFFDRLNTDVDLIVELQIEPDGTTYKWEGYARISGDSWTTPIDALMDEAVTLQIDGPLYYATTE